jgi:hypothetical protein
MLGELCPLCMRCRIVMRLKALQQVAGPNRERAHVSVYGCAVCGRMTAYELPRVDVLKRASYAVGGAP